MADTVVTRTIIDSKPKAVFIFGNASDGVGEAAVLKIDISTLDSGATKVRITRVKWAIAPGMNVTVLFDHTSDDTVLILNGDGEFTRDDLAGGVIDPASAGGTGDILFTTSGQAAGDGYTILMEIEKVTT